MAAVQIQKVIEQLGFSSKEAKVYLVALSLGESQVSDIAEKSGLPRTTVQVIVDRLHKIGLMNFYIMCRYKYWVAENPGRLLDNLKKREDALRDALPQITSLKNKIPKKDRQTDPTRILGLLQVLADSSSQPVLITNGEIEIEYVNPAWEKQFGYTLDEMKGQKPHAFKSDKTPPEVHKKMWEAIYTEKMFQSDQVIDKKKDGTYFKLLTTIFPIRYNGNVFFVQILDDITE